MKSIDRSAEGGRTVIPLSTDDGRPARIAIPDDDVGVRVDMGIGYLADACP